MARRRVTVIAEGRRYRLGHTSDYGGIWRRRPWGWRLVSQYPLTDEGRRVAEQQFAAWEPPGATAPAGSPPTRRRPLRWIWAAAAATALVAGGAVAVITNSTKGGVRRVSASHSALSTTTTTAPSAVGSGYLATGSGYAAFIQWNRQASGGVSGTLQLATTSGQPPSEQRSTDTISVLGSIHGSSISVSFDGHPQTFGTITNGSFTLDLPQTDGSLGAVTFNRATASDFNLALSRLSTSVQGANQAAAAAAAQQQAAQAAAAAQQKAEKRLLNDAQTLGSDVQSLSDVSSLQQGVSQVQAALNKEASYLAATKAAEQKVLAEAGSASQSTTCYDASQGVAYDASQEVAYEASQGVEYAAQQDVGYAVGQFNSLLAQTQSDLQQLHRDEQALPSFPASGAPSDAAVVQAEAEVNSAISSAVATSNAAIDQANGYVTTAYQYVSTAYQAGNCGQPPSAPTPQSHIKPN